LPRSKSQLAIEYAYRVRERSPEKWVFWVYASNAARFEQSYRDIADRVELAGRQDPQANIFKLMHDWLCKTRHKWMLVFDNVDDARFLLNVQPDIQGQAAVRPLREYLPHCEHGSILVTTRNVEAALRLVEKRDIIAVEPMDQANAVTLFEKKLDIQEDRGEIVKLATALEYMPLAIVQAAAYISQRSPRYSVARYLDDYTKSERKRTNLLDYDKGQLRRDWEAKNSIIVSWQISFEYIRQIRPSAAGLLSLMSFFDRQGIPESVLRLQEHRESGSNEEDKASQFSASDDDPENDEFEDDVALLHDFSFISSETNKKGFEMHALVQLATRRWLEVNGELERWKQQFISCLSEAFPPGKYENWTTCQALFAHAKVAVALKPEGKRPLTEWATLLYRAAWYALANGNALEAEQLAIKSMKARRQVLGQEDEDTWWSMSMLATVYRHRGRWHDAAKLEEEVLDICKAKLGEDHPDTLISMGNLASTYRHQGRLKEAQELGEKALEMRKAKLGEDHPDTLTSMSNMASTYWHQGRLKEAQELEEQALEMRKVKLGRDHLDTLASMNNLALRYWDQNRLGEAAELHEQVLEKSRTKLGEDHPDTLTSMSNLALTYRNQGRLKEAAELHKQALEKLKAKLGVDHPDTLISMSNLASTYWYQCRLKEAEELEEQALEMRKAKLGEDHPDTLISMGNLAMTYQNQGRLKEAQGLGEQALEMRKAKLGEDHPDTLTSMSNLAIIWKYQDRDADAICLMSECVELQRRVLEEDHPDYIYSLKCLSEWEAGRADRGLTSRTGNGVERQPGRREAMG
jgi:tetratricopeptide (TPR) repeat protein